jgi:hypothetical protein
MEYHRQLVGHGRVVLRCSKRDRLKIFDMDPNLDERMNSNAEVMVQEIFPHDLVFPSSAHSRKVSYYRHDSFHHVHIFQMFDKVLG